MQAVEHLGHEILIDLKHFPLESFDLLDGLQVGHVNEHVDHVLVGNHVVGAHVLP
jgi:hypothetical protein